jgi:ribonuclease HI
MGIGYVLEHTEMSRVLVRVGAQIGQGTNNEAEYQALLAGMRHALRLGFWDLRVVSDSKLVVEQVDGRWKVKDARLRRLHAEAVLLRGMFRTFELHHTRREGNAVADALSHELVFEEPTLPPLPGKKTSRHPRALYDWQAAAVRVWWLRDGIGAGVMSRIFGLDAAGIEQIGYGKSYLDATFASYPHHMQALGLPGLCNGGTCELPTFRGIPIEWTPSLDPQLNAHNPAPLPPVKPSDDPFDGYGDWPT